jgi:hypothetical protein
MPGPQAGGSKHKHAMVTPRSLSLPLAVGAPVFLPDAACSAQVLLSRWGRTRAAALQGLREAMLEWVSALK